MRACRLLASYFKNKAESYPILAQFADGFYENRFLEKHITDAIDDTGAIRDTASKELAHIRREIVETSSRLRSRLNKLLAKVSAEDLVTEEFITQSEKEDSFFQCELPKKERCRESFMVFQIRVPLSLSSHQKSLK
jgi:dsDNA-specific endonuclease/ATPase MutS2